MGKALELLKRFNDHELIIIRNGIAYCNGCSGQYSILKSLILDEGISMQVCNKVNENDFMIVKGVSYAN